MNWQMAANAYRLKKKYEEAKDAFEKASKGQEMLSSPWDAAKHMESAAALAKEVGKWNEVTDFYRHASDLYIECGRSQTASDALAKGARALEDSTPNVAVQLYIDSSAILEEDGKEQMAFDLYRAATSVYIKLEKYTDAATILLRWALAVDKSNATHSQCELRILKFVYLVSGGFRQMINEKSAKFVAMMEKQRYNHTMQANLKNMSCEDISENIKCKMLLWCCDEVVAEDRIASTDPKAKKCIMFLWEDRVEKFGLIKFGLSKFIVCCD